VNEAFYAKAQSVRCGEVHLSKNVSQHHRLRRMHRTLTQAVRDRQTVQIFVVAGKTQTCKILDKILGLWYFS
jgi:hypothetical protein